MNSQPRNIIETDLDWVLALNRTHEVELSPLSGSGLSRLVAEAAYCRVVDDRAAYLIAFDQDADYDSPNFLWFKDRLDQFVYVDRIAVSDRYRGRGLARLLYEDRLWSPSFACITKFGLDLADVGCQGFFHRGRRLAR